MPTYLYRCDNGHEFELFHSIKDESAKRCPTCDAPAHRVPAGGGGLLFKGSGFYITDYRSSSYQKGAKAEGGAAPKPAEGGAAKPADGGAKPKPPPGGAGGASPGA